MAAHRDRVALGGVGDQAGRGAAVEQVDEGGRDRRRPVELVEAHELVAQVGDGALEALRGALDARRSSTWCGGSRTSPGRSAPGPRWTGRPPGCQSGMTAARLSEIGTRPAARSAASRPARQPEGEALEQRGARPGGWRRARPVQAHLAGGVQPRDGGPAAQVGHHAAAGVVRRRHHRDALAGACRCRSAQQVVGDGREALGQLRAPVARGRGRRTPRRCGASRR